MLKGWEENEGEAPEVCEAQIAAFWTPFPSALSLHLSGVSASELWRWCVLRITRHLKTVEVQSAVMEDQLGKAGW